MVPSSTTVTPSSSAGVGGGVVTTAAGSFGALVGAEAGLERLVVDELLDPLRVAVLAVAGAQLVRFGHQVPAPLMGDPFGADALGRLVLQRAEILLQIHAGAPRLAG